jgi:threonine synthase
MIPRRCLGCGARQDSSPPPWRCPACASPFDYDFSPSPESLREGLACTRIRGTARWLAALPLERPGGLVSLGEGAAPFVEQGFGPLRVVLLLDHLNPSGSYKDRGAVVLVSALVEEGAREAVEDSSGNAGASLALYASARSLPVSIFVPSTASQGKRRLIERLGAALVLCGGSSPAEARREAAKQAESAAGRAGVFYASHVWHPGFRHGVKTAAFEIAAELGSAPAAVVFPLGHGALALGLAKGFSELALAGAIPRLPMLIGVQAAACAPVARKYSRLFGGEPLLEEPGETACEGIRIDSPPLSPWVCAAIAATDGEVVTATEEQTRAAHDDLWRRGFPVEVTSAIVAAALLSHGGRWKQRLSSAGREGPVVAILTGSGLKSI